MTTALPPESPESVSAGQKTGISVAEIPREQRVAALLLSRYNLRYLVRLYAAFEGDLLLPIVLGEVAMYNVSGLLPDDPATLAASFCDDPNHIPLRPCNAFSISSSTGIPRETVRRKVSHLILHGWIDRDTRGGLTITPKAVALCLKPFHEDNQSDFLATADRVWAALGAPRHA